MAQRPASSPTRPARRTVAQKAPRARAAAGSQLGDDGLDLDDIDEQLDTASVLSVAGVLDARRNSGEDSGRFFD